MLRQNVDEQLRKTRVETGETIQTSVRNLGDILSSSQEKSAAAENRRFIQMSEQLSLRQDAMQKSIGSLVTGVDKRMADFSVQNEAKLENIRTLMENRLSAMRDDHAKRLEQIRETVDEKLEKTLTERVGQSFKLVNERLEQVYKGLGEMQTIAVGVGDLKKVLSNVKTRGVLGEVQLGAILEEILPPEQYAANVATKKGSSNVVEYAVKLPGADEGTVWLPIDAKFPADAYSKLCDAYDVGDKEAVAKAGAELEQRIKQFAKDIHNKYIEPPETTEFGVMFLPFEGLYAEVVRRGLLEKIQHMYKITVAGPATMAALLNSLQMGFRTLAIQKRSGEVWQVLGAVKTEFGKFSDVLASTQQRLEQANRDLDKLVGTRTRQIQRKLKDVSALPEMDTRTQLDEIDLQR
ncbi:MAG TPA: DNA recombination protein RmuC [Ruminococcaceae bacterium]|nr:DNA recombination protein RmuC [Oscillospiraceae bacterium]